jgi:hypothetical protein
MGRMKKLVSIFIFLMLILPARATVQDSLAETTVAQYTDTITTVSRTFSPAYKDNYKTPEFDYERKENNKKLSKFEEFLRWLSDLFSLKGSSNGESFSFEHIIKIIAGIIVILVVVYMIAWALLKKEGYWIFGKSRKNITAQDIDVENIEITNFQSLINSTSQSGDYRMGIRYYYLWLLKLLAYNNIIKWHRDKTNNDYLYEIKDETLRSQFRYLSYIYDYSWYGEFPLNKVDYAKAEKAFTEIINRLKR